MSPKETERSFLSKVSEYLVSLPFDLKVLQEAVSDPDLDRGARELAAGAVMHTLSPQEGEPGPLRFVDDVLLVRAALHRIVEKGGEGAKAFRDRFSEIYGTLDEDLRVFEEYLGETWRWLMSKVDGFSKSVYKGKRASQYIEDEQALSFLYEEGLEFQTNYNVSEEQVRNKLRRSEQVVENLKKRRAEEAKKIG
jgi:hypothetical protein